ncbi:PP2C family protein-serine/threonine phosphatase [Microbacterium oleivorans]|uniref:Serine/threonine-protein phosphatase n=1 Tax=Microbacterium oleivorans TaxID=273677 RepID=A0A7D5IPD5_9MICO|nr:protein phosphatase 2C domain-containing protein [Microbacterium oleivorans]QLD10701.1 serine/threonine-protein phosphatase [Microbacterium oleivorans]
MTDTTTPVDIHVTSGSRTDPGRRRRVNEDALLAEYPVFLVADGMGGHEAGDRASAAVIDVFRVFAGRDDLRPEEVSDAVERAHSAVADIAAGTARGAGSTLSGVVAVHQDGTRRWLIVNVGDSRVYRLLAERLEQLTIDHSVAQELVDAGRLAREEMATFEGRNVITRAIGGERSRADYWLIPIVTGERIVVCSDGLTGEISDEAIRAGLMMGGSPAGTAESLVAQALAHGGRDNISAIVLDVIAGGISPRLEDTTGGFMNSESVTATVEVATARSRRHRSAGG